VALDATKALVSRKDALDYLGIKGNNKNKLVEGIINRSSDIVAKYCDRVLLVPAADYVEYHTIEDGDHILETLDYPIVAVTDVAEDADRVYSTLLTVTDDYIVSKPRKLIRVSGAVTTSWEAGFRAVRVQYTAGYTVATMPGEIADVVLKLCAVTYREIDRQAQGVSSITDDMGSINRFYSARLSNDMKEQLSTHKRVSFHCTGVRDS